MTKKRNLDRERLEVFLMHWLMAYRLWMQIGGWMLLLYGAALLAAARPIGLGVVSAAVLVLLPSYNYGALLWLARAGAWVGTVGRRG